MATQGLLDEEFGFYPLRLQYVIQLTALFPEATLSLHSLVGPLIINSQLPSPLLFPSLPFQCWLYPQFTLSVFSFHDMQTLNYFSLSRCFNDHPHADS